MFNKIVHVFFSKFLAAILGLFIVIVNAKQLGAEGLGLISLIVLSITINQIVSGIVGGTSLMYLASRKPVFELLVPSYLWAFASSLIATSILNLFDLMPQQYATDIYLLSVLQALGSIHLNLFIGLEKLQKYNRISVIQVVISFVSLLVLFFVFNYKTVESYIISMYLGYGYVFIFSALVIYPEIKLAPVREWGNSIKSIFQNSIYIQLATIVHLFNCRVSYFLLDRYMDKAALGIYSTAVSIAESIWLISRSISVFQYSKVANSSEINTSRELTLILSKFSILITVACAGIMLIFPQLFFVWLFGEKFGAIKHLLIYILPGIAFMANSSLYVHYYAAIGKNHVNTIASTIGFVFTLVCCYFLIPRYHLSGAAISTSISYLAYSLFMIFLFKNEAGYQWKDFLLKRSELKYGLVEARSFFS